MAKKENMGNSLIPYNELVKLLRKNDSKFSDKTDYHNALKLSDSVDALNRKYSIECKYKLLLPKNGAANNQNGGFICGDIVMPKTLILHLLKLNVEKSKNKEPRTKAPSVTQLYGLLLSTQKINVTWSGTMPIVNFESSKTTK
jgi:hypothetical protein